MTINIIICYLHYSHYWKLLTQLINAHPQSCLHWKYQPEERMWDFPSLSSVLSLDLRETQTYIFIKPCPCAQLSLTPLGDQGPAASALLFLCAPSLASPLALFHCSLCSPCPKSGSALISTSPLTPVASVRYVGCNCFPVCFEETLFIFRGFVLR